MNSHNGSEPNKDIKLAGYIVKQQYSRTPQGGISMAHSSIIPNIKVGIHIALFILNLLSAALFVFLATATWTRCIATYLFFE